MIGLPVVLAPTAASAATQWIQPDFNLTRTDDVSQFVPNPTNFVFLAGTNNLIGIGKCGDIGLGRMPNADGLASTQWSNISWPGEDKVTCAPTDRGLLGIDVDPGTTTVYLLYNYTPPPTEACKDGTTTITTAPDGTPHIYGRLTKLTMSSATAPSSFSGEQVLLDCLPAFSATPENDGHGDDSHTVGSVVVAPDHTLFVSNGEASSYTVADSSALNSQDVSSPRGKIFHLNPDGSPAAGNPFTGSYWAQRGLRLWLPQPVPVHAGARHQQHARTSATSAGTTARRSTSRRAARTSGGPASRVRSTTATSTRRCPSARRCTPARPPT